MRVSWGPFLVCVIIALAIRVLLLATPFKYVPDIYYYDQQAVSALASGSDPYGHLYSVPAELLTLGAERVFAYLPGVLVFLFPFGVLTDVRAGLVLCDFLVAAFIVALGGPNARKAAALFLLLPPVVLFSTYYPNNTLVGMAFLGGYVLYERRQNLSSASVLLGLSVGASQFTWLLVPFIGLKALESGRLRYLFMSGAVAACVIVPFFLWDPGAFWGNVVSFQVARPPQAVITPEPFGYNFNPTLSGVVFTATGGLVPVWLKAIILLPLLAYLLTRQRRSGGYVIAGGAFLAAAVFILPNDFSWWYLEFPFQLLLIWWVSRAAPNGPAKP